MLRVRYRPAVAPAYVKVAFTILALAGHAPKAIAYEYDSTYRTVRTSICLVFEMIMEQFGHLIKLSTVGEAKASAALCLSQHRLPGCVGAVDGTHIPIRVPGDSLRTAYYSKENGYDVVLHIFVDHMCVACVAVFASTWFGVFTVGSLPRFLCCAAGTESGMFLRGHPAAPQTPPSGRRPLAVACGRT